MKVGTIIAGFICIGSLGAAGFFGNNAYNNFSQIQLIDKSLVSIEQNIDLCKSSLPAEKDTVTYYDIYMEIANIAGINISKIYVNSEENEIIDASELHNLGQGSELHVVCTSIYQTAIIDIIRLPNIVLVVQTNDSMEVIIKL